MLAKSIKMMGKGYVKISLITTQKRTENGYFLVPFREIHEKFVEWKCHYRHIDPSPLEEEVGSHVLTEEVLVEQDDTLHEKKFRFEYLHGDKKEYSEKEE